MSTLKVDYKRSEQDFISTWCSLYAETHGMDPRKAKLYILRAIKEEREMPQYADCPAMAARGEWLMSKDRGGNG